MMSKLHVVAPVDEDLAITFWKSLLSSYKK